MPGIEKNAALLVALFGLMPALPQAPSAARDELTFRISSNLVQLDAIVTGAKGERPSDLKLQDFRILLDGKPQEIRLCEYVAAGGHVSGAGLKAALPEALAPDKLHRKIEASRPYMPPSALKPEEVRRTVVLFVDDFNMSAESVPNVRSGLRKFIERQLQPGDLIAIVRASAGLGALQDFTQDRRMLLAAADQVRWNPRGGGEMDAYTPVRDALNATSPGEQYMRQENEIDRVMRFTLLATDSLRRLVHGMTSLPGRKSVVVLSDHMPLATPDELTSPGDSSTATGSGMFGGPILSSMRRLVDESTRSGVVLYAIDTRRINSLVATAQDQVQLPLGASEGADAATIPGGKAPPTSVAMPGAAANTADNAAEAYGDSTRLKIGQKMQKRYAEQIENQWGGIFLTSQTGGFMVTESNRIDAGLERVVNDQQGYYVLGFTPAAEVLRPDEHGGRIYHRVKIEVLRSGLKVRTHSGFFGISDEDATRAERGDRPELLSALESPFQSQGVGVEVRAAFLNAKKNQSFLRTEVSIDGRTLKLTGPPQHLTGVIHLLARAFAVSGEQLVGGIDEHLRVDLNAEGYQRALKYGLIYTTLIEVPKPGPYQMRVACSDESTGKIGSASDFVDVPQVKGRSIVLSGLVIAGERGDYDVVVPASGPSYFIPGQRAAFAFQVLRAPGAASTGDRGLTLRTRLFRDAEQIAESPSAPVVSDARKNAAQFFTRGEIDIPAGLAAGEYLLRVDVESRTAKKPQLAWRWARLTVRDGG